MSMLAVVALLDDTSFSLGKHCVMMSQTLR